MKHGLPKLPWQADALTGAISATTIDFHYGKHTRTYLENVDKLAAETPLSELPLDGIVRVADGALLNNAAQAWNHLFYFLTSSLRHPKIFVKEFSDFLMSCHQHCLGVNLLVQR